MNYKSKIKNFIGASTIILTMFSCSVNDDYKSFVEDGEISYTGKIDSLKIYAGKNRVLMKGLIFSDPKVRELRAFWNGRKDSVSVPVQRTENTDTISYLIENLNENVYTFEVRTYDDLNNKSIAQFETAEVYGERYQASLNNRPVVTNVLEGADLTINFGTMDMTSGVFGTEVEYTSTSGEINKLFVDINDESLHLTDFENGTSYRHRSFFLPEPTAIDTFQTDYISKTPFPTPTLGNATQPFEAEMTMGRWGTLAAPWVTNMAARSHFGVGGWDNGCCPGREQTFNLECGWGQPTFTNAKIHQAVMAEGGINYTLVVDVISTNYSSSDLGGGYIVIALGDGLPDLNQINASNDSLLAFKKVDANWGPVTINLPFILDETSQISVGMVATQTGDKYCNIKSWEIM